MENKLVRKNSVNVYGSLFLEFNFWVKFYL